MSNNIAHIKPAQALYNPKDLDLIRRTVAADTNDDEFSLFIHMARALELDPLRRQIYAFVYNKTKKTRRMSIVTGIDGFRSIAARTGDYRPDDQGPVYEYDSSLVGPENPLGIVQATVRVFKFTHGEWHAVAATAYWDEYAPITEYCPDGYTQVDTGETWPDGNPKKLKKPNSDERVRKLDDSGQWAKMPRLMLAKCAEAAALRKAWPDNFADVYAAEEVDRSKLIDASPAELAEQGRIDARLDRAGVKGGCHFVWNEGDPIDIVPAGQAADRILAYFKEHPEPAAILAWVDRNRLGLRELHSHSKGDALAIKAEVEKAARRLAADAAKVREAARDDE